MTKIESLADCLRWIADNHAQIEPPRNVNEGDFTLRINCRIYENSGTYRIAFDLGNFSKDCDLIERLKTVIRRAETLPNFKSVSLTASSLALRLHPTPSSDNSPA